MKRAWLQVLNLEAVGWTVDTASILTYSSAEIPVNEYYEYFGPDYKLDVRSSNMEDLNGREYLDRVRSIVTDRLRDLGGPPGVQMMGKSTHVSAATISGADSTVFRYSQTPGG